MNDDDLLFAFDDLERRKHVNELRRNTLLRRYDALSAGLENLRQTLPSEDWERLNAPIHGEHSGSVIVPPTEG